MAGGQTGQTRGRSLLVFTFAGLTCALPLSDVQEVVPMALLSTPPGLPLLLEGFLNLRGAAVPVLRLARLFGFPPGSLHLETRLLILRQRQAGEGAEPPSSLLGLLVDSVREIIQEDPEKWVPVAPSALLNDCCVAQTGLGGSAIYLLSAERLLTSQERQTLARLEVERQNRFDEMLQTA
jgi:purine-binding chemotaxis protein CheW